MLCSLNITAYSMNIGISSSIHQRIAKEVIAPAVVIVALSMPFFMRVVDSWTRACAQHGWKV